MSAERKTICTISVVIDHDCGNYHIGEIDGAFQDGQLYDHIKTHGATELIEHLCYLQWQVYDTLRAVNFSKSESAQKGSEANARHNL